MVRVRNIEDAERILKNQESFGLDFDKAVAFLIKHDKNNKVLKFLNRATQKKTIDKNINAEKVKRLNSYFRRVVKENDFDIEKMNEAEAVWKSITGKEFTYDDLFGNDKPLNNTNNQSAKDNNTDKKQTSAAKKALNDDEIAANLTEINDIISSPDIQEVIIQDTNKLRKKVNIVDENNNKLDEEKADNLWVVKMRTALQEAAMHRAEDEKFAAKDKANKVKTIISDTRDFLWSDIFHMAGISQYDEKKSDADYSKDFEKAQNDFAHGKTVTVKSDHFINSAVNTKLKMEEKEKSFEAKGFKKSAEIFGKMRKGFSQFLYQYLGSPAEIKEGAIRYFSSKRGIANTVASAALISTTGLVAVTGGAPIAIGTAVAAMAGYGIYQSKSYMWDLFEKRAIMKAQATAKQQDTKAWTGTLGLKNAFNAIQANPREKKRFDRKRKINNITGWGSALLVGAMVPVMMGAGAGLGLTALAGGAAFAATRFGASLVRVLGANANAGAEVVEAYKAHKEDKTEQSKLGLTRSIGHGTLGLLFSGFAEYLMASNVSDQFAEQHALQTEHLAENGGNGESLENSQEGEVSDKTNEGTDNTVVDSFDPSTVDLKEGLTEEEYTWLKDKAPGIFAKHAEIFGMNDESQEKVFNNIITNIHNAQEAGTLPNEPIGVIAYKYVRLVDYSEQNVPVTEHPEYLQSKLGADGEPMYWVDAKEMKALNHIILCGEETDVSAEDLAKSLNRWHVDEGNFGQYYGEGKDKLITNNRFVGLGRGEDCPDGHQVNAWERGKSFVKKLFKPAQDADLDTGIKVEEVETPAPLQEEIHVEDVKMPDADLDTGMQVQTKVGFGTGTMGDAGQYTINPATEKTGGSTTLSAVSNAGKELTPAEQAALVKKLGGLVK